MERSFQKRFQALFGHAHFCGKSLPNIGPPDKVQLKRKTTTPWVACAMHETMEKPKGGHDIAKNETNFKNKNTPAKEMHVFGQDTYNIRIK